MRKTLLMTNAAALAFCGVTFALPAAAAILYDQMEDFSGGSVLSQSYLPSSAAYNKYDNQSADDFVVPAGTQWTIDTVKVAGYYIFQSGPTVSKNVVIYADNNGLPGAVVKEYDRIRGNEAIGNFVLNTHGLVLPAGHYWLSVSANNSSAFSGSEWDWATTTTKKHGYGAVWRNPGNGYGFGCTTYTLQTACISFAGPDNQFQLLGTAATVQ